MKKESFTKNHDYWKVISENTGYDFSGYSTITLNRRLESFISNESIGSADELRDILFSDTKQHDKILGRLLISFTEMFRDPEFFQSVRKVILPYLSIYPRINIWHAGCSTGEEVFSLAILLEELQLLSRCVIYATDVNNIHINNAAAGIFPLQRMQEASSRYYRSGGNKNLSDYYTAYYGNIIFHSHLRDRIKFIKHDMILDKPPATFHLIFCRNVFIYFNYEVQQKVLVTMSNSLNNYGYLGMGFQEQFIDIKNKDLTRIDESNNIYRKVV